ncbi:hypothetical protein NDU88_000993 [Pleurodeles waltl]|uniref:Uncharacterized protein n=1 Tax=Pleurodeles waltl TaxID=8319 RepID=A0AAV7LK38_PLEWA|nr:hypothetical protein NDU88_000993 [Pleurodeles waltl]
MRPRTVGAHCSLRARERRLEELLGRGSYQRQVGLLRPALLNGKCEGPGGIAECVLDEPLIPDGERCEISKGDPPETLEYRASFVHFSVTVKNVS